jgi:hypothetical protein
LYRFQAAASDEVSNGKEKGENVQTTHQTARSLREGGPVCKLMSCWCEFIFASEKSGYHAVANFFA